MGKKGKGSHNVQLRNIDTSIEHARKTAYDHKAIDTKRSELASRQRRRLIFPHLNSLIMQRARDDVRGGAILGSTGTIKDKSWEQYFLRQGSKDKRTAFADTVTKNMKQKFHSWLLPIPNDRVVPTLATLCIQTVSKSLPLYAPEDVQFALSTVSHQKTEQLSLLSSIDGTQLDEFLTCFQHELVDRLYLSEHITDCGIKSLLSTKTPADGHFSDLDSWENIELSDLNTSACMNLSDITLLGSAISSASLGVLDDHCPHLQRLCLYDVQFAADAGQVDPTVFCLQLLESLSAGFQALVSLELRYCHWVRLEALTLWGRRIETTRRHSEATSTLRSLKFFTITGIEDYLTESSGAHNGEALEQNSEAVWEPLQSLFAGVQGVHHTTSSASSRKATQLAQLRDSFHTQCGITVTIEM